MDKGIFSWFGAINRVIELLRSWESTQALELVSASGGPRQLLLLGFEKFHNSTTRIIDLKDRLKSLNESELIVCVRRYKH